MLVGVVGGRSLNQTGQDILRPRQIRRRDPEVARGRGREAAEPAAEVHLGQVHLQDLRLVVLRLECERQHEPARPSRSGCRWCTGSWRAAGPRWLRRSRSGCHWQPSRLLVGPRGRPGRGGSGSGCLGGDDGDADPVRRRQGCRVVRGMRVQPRGDALLRIPDRRRNGPQQCPGPDREQHDSGEQPVTVRRHRRLHVAGSASGTAPVSGSDRRRQRTRAGTGPAPRGQHRVQGDRVTPLLPSEAGGLGCVAPTRPRRAGRSLRQRSQRGQEASRVGAPLPAG